MYIYNVPILVLYVLSLSPSLNCMYPMYIYIYTYVYTYTRYITIHICTYYAHIMHILCTYYAHIPYSYTYVVCTVHIIIYILSLYVYDIGIHLISSDIATFV